MRFTIAAPGCGVSSDLRVLDAARAVVDDVNQLISTSRGRTLYEVQLRNAAASIAANIREGYGRRAGGERNQFLRYARGSVEETDEHLRANYAATRIPTTTYWRLHNRLVVIARMLTKLTHD